MRWCLVALVLVGLTACVGPAPTVGQYEGKAAHTAQDALSQLETARLAVENATRMPAAYLETVLVDAEQSFGSVQATFDSIQPPDEPAADALKAALDPLLSDGSDGIVQLRILARRGNRAGMAKVSHDLAATADRLDRFGTEHAG
jgi:hypothetical protein